MANQREYQPSVLFDYASYPHLHIEDSRRKIREIAEVIPSSFRARNILDVGSDAGLITRAVGKKYRANHVVALDLSLQAIELTGREIGDFTQFNVEQKSFEEYETNNLYDLIMFIDVLEHLNDPLLALQKASTMGRFIVVRSPLEDSAMNKINKRFLGKDYQKIMEQRYGHIHHFSLGSLKGLLQEGGFDLVRERNFRVPVVADVLQHQSHRHAEALSWSLFRGIYPNLWGGFYVAFCKSRKVQVMDSASELELIELVKEEFGENNLVSLALFGSLVTGDQKQHSDYDFTVILKSASPDINERESASPRLKNRLRERGVRELCAFNIYTQAEFEAADRRNSWLIETMRSGYRIMIDSNDYLNNKLTRKKPSVEQIEPFAWKGIQTENPKRFMEVSKRHRKCAEILMENFPKLALYHNTEAYRGELIEKLLRHGIYNSRGSLLDIATILKRRFNEQINLNEVQWINFHQEMQGIPALYEYKNVDLHLAAANQLFEHGLNFDALFHTYSALKCMYLESLHSNHIYALDGEITQLFVREQAKNLPQELIERIYRFSFKAEQLLGRTGYISFDLDKDGLGIFANKGRDEVDSLMKGLNLIISDLKKYKARIIQSSNGRSQISLAIATYNRPEYLERCLESARHLLIPENNLEVVIVDDGSSKKYNIESLKGKYPFPIKYIKKEHSGICATKNKAIEESEGEFVAFIDDDMVVSPLWLIQLMSGFLDERIAGVGSTNLTYPNDDLLTVYSNYRELARRPFRDETGEVLNVLTGSACLRKNVLEEIGGFNQDQSDSGVLFGGDDVDITWKIRDKGYQFIHIKNAKTFHNHRNTAMSFVKQHIGYGEGTMFHCIARNRNPSELGIPQPTFRAVSTDILYYLSREVPKRILECYKDNLGIRMSLVYPILDFTRRFFYDIGILKARRHLK
ncbi:hypothetical protein DRO91_06210 [Candidatus Heimdallarchaeota archaeon]|nr:MAG: hypothetical protein DRO91_06210 [Candidatus Heimdallarchaeota archaeon]